jgi:hypothetical protein
VVCAASTKPENSAYGRPCQHSARNNSARTAYSSLQTSPVPSRLLPYIEIFKRHTDLVHPLSLDQACLDVTEIRLAYRPPHGLQAPMGEARVKFRAKLITIPCYKNLYCAQRSEREQDQSPIRSFKLAGMSALLKILHALKCFC